MSLLCMWIPFRRFRNALQLVCPPPLSLSLASPLLTPPLHIYEISKRIFMEMQKASPVNTFYQTRERHFHRRGAPSGTLLRKKSVEWEETEEWSAERARRVVYRAVARRVEREESEMNCRKWKKFRRRKNWGMYCRKKRRNRRMSSSRKRLDRKGRKKESKAFRRGKRMYELDKRITIWMAYISRGKYLGKIVS